MLEVRSVAESELEALRCEFKAALEESVSSTGTIKQAVAKLILDVERMQVCIRHQGALPYSEGTGPGRLARRYRRHQHDRWQSHRGKENTMLPTIDPLHLRGHSVLMSGAWCALAMPRRHVCFV
jgi:hypothetical protein